MSWSNSFAVPRLSVVSLLLLCCSVAADERVADQLRGKQQVLRDKVSHMQSQVEALSTRLQEFEKEVKAGEQEITALERQFGAAESAANAEKLQVQMQLRRVQLTMLSTEADQVRVQLAKSKALIDQHLQQLAETQKQIQQEAGARQNPSRRSPREEVTHRLQELHTQLAEAIESGKQEIAAHLRKEIREFIKAKANESMRETRKNAEDVVKQQIELLEHRIRELREQGKPEIAERLTAHLKEWLQSRHAEQLAEHQELRQREDALHAEESRTHAESMKPKTAEPNRQERHDMAEEQRRRMNAMMEEQHRREQTADQDARNEAIARRAEEVRDRAESMKREIVQLHDRGHHEEAERLEQALHTMLERQQHVKPADPKPHHLGAKEREELERRLHHLRVAAENLAAIEMHDLVERLNREAEEVERALHGPGRAGHDSPEGVRETVEHEFRAIHQRLDELTHRLEQLSELHRKHDEH